MITRTYTCRTVRNMLPLHVGNDLDPRHVSGVDRHLDSCPGCTREFSALAAMRGRLGVLAEEPLPRGILDGFTAEVMARIAVGEPGPAAEPPHVARRQTILSLPRLATAAAAVLVAFAGLRAVQDAGVATPRDESATSRLAGTVSDGVWDGVQRRVRPGPGPVVTGAAEAPDDGAAEPLQVQLPPALAGMLNETPLPSEVDVMIRERSGHLQLITPPAGLELDEDRQPRSRRDDH